MEISRVRQVKRKYSLLPRNLAHPTQPQLPLPSSVSLSSRLLMFSSFAKKESAGASGSKTPSAGWRVSADELQKHARTLIGERRTKVQPHVEAFNGVATVHASKYQFGYVLGGVVMFGGLNAAIARKVTFLAGSFGNLLACALGYGGGTLVYQLHRTRWQLHALDSIDESIALITPLELKHGRQVPEYGQELDTLRTLRRQIDPRGVVKHRELSDMKQMLSGFWTGGASEGAPQRKDSNRRQGLAVEESADESGADAVEHGAGGGVVQSTDASASSIVAAYVQRRAALKAAQQTD